MKDSVLDRVTAKDVGEELGILIRDTILPEEIGGMACSVREKTKLNYPFTDMLDRFLGELPQTAPVERRPAHGRSSRSREESAVRRPLESSRAQVARMAASDTSSCAAPSCASGGRNRHAPLGCEPKNAAEAHHPGVRAKPHGRKMACFPCHAALSGRCLTSASCCDPCPSCRSSCFCYFCASCCRAPLSARLAEQTRRSEPEEAPPMSHQATS